MNAHLQKYKMPKYKIQPLSHRDDHETIIPEWCKENGITISKLANEIGVAPTPVYHLAYGYSSPIWVRGNYAGTIKPVASKICDYLLADLDEVFPRYFCNLKLHHLKQIQEHDIFDSWSLKISEKDSIFDEVARLEFLEKLKELISNSRNTNDNEMSCNFYAHRKFQMVILHYFEGNTLKEIGEIHNISAENVRMCIAKCLRLLRHPMRSKILIDYY